MRNLSNNHGSSMISNGIYIYIYNGNIHNRNTHNKMIYTVHPAIITNSTINGSVNPYWRIDDHHPTWAYNPTFYHGTNRVQFNIIQSWKNDGSIVQNFKHGGLLWFKCYHWNFGRLIKQSSLSSFHSAGRVLHWKVSTRNVAPMGINLILSLVGRVCPWKKKPDGWRYPLVNIQKTMENHHF